MASNPDLPQPTTSPARGIPIWIALIALFVLALAGAALFGGFWFYQRSEQLRNERERAQLQARTDRAELQVKNAAEDAKLTLARNQQEQILAQVRAATNALLTLLATTDVVRTEAAALRTNDTGRILAQHPDLVRLARQFYEGTLRELPPESEIIPRLENVRRTEQQLLAAQGTAYNPAPDLGVAIANATTWAEQLQTRSSTVQQQLGSLVQEAKTKFSRTSLGESSPTLAEAIDQLNQGQARERLQATEKTVSAAQAAALAAENQAEVQRITAEADRKTQELEAKLKDAQVELARERDKKQAQEKVVKAEHDAEVDRTKEEARKVTLRAKASDPKVQAKLTAFTTPGYWQRGKMVPEKVPWSYAALQATGALQPDMHGLGRLVGLGISNYDAVRPRWPYHATAWARHPDQIEEIKEAQALLIELGPTLVEMKLLLP